MCYVFLTRVWSNLRCKAQTECLMSAVSSNEDKHNVSCLRLTDH